MGRSSTLPTSQPGRNDSRRVPDSPKRLNRNVSVQVPAKKKHHLPFHHTQSPPSSANGSQSQAQAQRFGAPNRQNSAQTRYINMLLDLDTIPRMHNIFAAFFTWILLAGFVIFPATFTSLSARLDSDEFKNNPQAEALLKLSSNKEWLVYIAAICSGLGALGMIWLWWRWRTNYVWLLNRIFLTGCLNSLAGLISTLVNVYSQQAGVWSTQAWATLGVTGGSMVICGALFAVYNFWVLQKIKNLHGREMSQMQRGYEGEGLVEKLERKANEPALEPGSVV
jgi:hypothetical protein